MCVAKKKKNRKKSNKIRSKATKKWYLGQAESLHSPTHPTSLLIIKRSKKLNVPDMCSLFSCLQLKKCIFDPSTKCYQHFLSSDCNSLLEIGEISFIVVQNKLDFWPKTNVLIYSMKFIVFCEYNELK